MTPQEKLLLYGVLGAAVAKFYYKKPLIFSAMVGLSTISAIAILQAHAEPAATV